MTNELNNQLLLQSMRRIFPDIKFPAPATQEQIDKAQTTNGNANSSLEDVFKWTPAWDLFSSMFWWRY